MRLKITRALRGSIDGIQLTHFEPGQIYDVGTSLGSYLLSERAAEPVSDDPRTIAAPFDKTALKDLQQKAGERRDRAADRTSRSTDR